jgi:mono/diheme cytochrome c family protein
MYKTWYDWMYVRSPITKILIGIITVLISFAALVVQGFFFEEKRMAAQTDSWNGRSIEKGAELFAGNCASCHGPDGKGQAGVAPALHSRYFFEQRLTDVGFAGTLFDYVESTVASGRPSKPVGKSQWAQVMPTWSTTFGGPLRPDQIVHITNFVMNWRDNAVAQAWVTQTLTTTTNVDPWQPFVDAPSKAEKDTLAWFVGTPAQLRSTAATSGTVGSDVAAGARPPQQLYVDMACAGCHKLGPHNVAVAGPDQNTLPETAATRVAGQDAETYVYTSIVDPNAYVVEGYPTGIMPANFTERMSEEEIRALVQWMLDPNRQY